jgi:quercetin dioxygenase-like cupin family protein
MLSQIESSVVSPSITTLFAICNAMGMDMAYLMKSLNHTTPVHVYNPEKRPTEDYKNAFFEKLVPQSDSPNGAQFLLLEIQPGQEISLRGQGIDISAMGYVIDGQVLVILEDTKDILLKKGDSILFRSLIPHTFRNTGKTLFRAVWSLTPLSHDFPTK